MFIKMYCVSILAGGDIAANFVSASGRCIEVSEAAHTKAKAMFADILYERGQEVSSIQI